MTIFTIAIIVLFKNVCVQFDPMLRLVLNMGNFTKGLTCSRRGVKYAYASSFDINTMHPKNLKGFRQVIYVPSEFTHNVFIPNLNVTKARSLHRLSKE